MTRGLQHEMKDGIQRMNCSVYFKDNISDTFPFMQNFGDGHSGGRDYSSEIRTKTKTGKKRIHFLRSTLFTKKPYQVLLVPKPNCSRPVLLAVRLPTGRLAYLQVWGDVFPTQMMVT